MSEGQAEIRFGTDGVRGPAGVWPIDLAGAERVGRAVAAFAGPGRRVVIGRDSRPSGAELEAAIARGVARGRCVAVVAGVAPTAAIAVAAAAGVGAIGVVVTASHNPASDNGFKVLGPGGSKLDDDQIAQVESLCDVDLAALPGGSVEDGADAVRAAYAAALDRATPDRARLAGRTLAIDLANGAAAPWLDWLVANVPARIVPIAAGDGLINDGCGAVHPERLAAAVRAHGCDAGFAVDGDADRCVLVDGTGAVVPGDTLTWKLARATGARGLAVTVMSTAALEGALPGVRVVRTAVGDRHLAEAMATHDLPLGAEESGHVLFAGLPAGDGLVTGLRALAACADAPTITEGLAGFTPFPRVLDKVRSSQKIPLDDLPGWVDALAEAEGRVGDGGRVFVRWSGTEPVVRVLAEGPDAARVRGVAAEVVAWLRDRLPG
jgi:phosphoglucosamine mutase